MLYSDSHESGIIGRQQGNPMAPHAIALVLFSAVCHAVNHLPIQRPVAGLSPLAHRHRSGPHLGISVFGREDICAGGCSNHILRSILGFN